MMAFIHRGCRPCAGLLHLLWATCMLSSFLGSQYSVNGHPQCLDFQPPFEAKPSLQFCPEYSDFGCCTREADRALKRQHDDILAGRSSGVRQGCAEELRLVLCLRCSPFAAHIFDVESKFSSANDVPLPSAPGLCRSFCNTFFQNCKSVLALVPSIPDYASNETVVERFCDRLTISDPDYCYPRVLNDADRETELRTSQTSAEGCLCLEPFAKGLRSPLVLDSPNDLTGRIMVGEQKGLVYVYDRDGIRRQRPFLNLTAAVLTSNRRGDERGFLGLAFHPQFERNKTLYVFYSVWQDNKQLVRISEFRISLDDPNVVDHSYERILLEVDQPFANHNGGAIVFGTDGYLYLFLGDGGAGGDPLGSGQNNQTLLGSVLRIDVESRTGDKPYGIPPDNPFIDDKQIPPEIYATGIRNIWRCDVDEGDPQNRGKNKGRIICGDVGQSAYEELDVILKGKNYGWNIKEGFECFRRETCNFDYLEDPIYAYPHSVGKSVTGGHMYRGCRSPELNGLYFYGDYINGKLFSLREDESGQWINNRVSMCGPDVCFQGLTSDYEVNILSFGEDFDGEIYILTTKSAKVEEPLGAVYKIVDPRRRGDPASCRLAKKIEERLRTTTVHPSTGSTGGGTGPPSGSTPDRFGTGTPGGTRGTGGTTTTQGTASGAPPLYPMLRTAVIPITTCILVPIVTCVTQFV